MLRLEETPIPKLVDAQALIRVHAAGVGPWDALVRTGGSGLQQTLPLTPGSDVAGVIEHLNAGATTDLAEGQSVYGVTNATFTDGYAEYAAADLRSIAPKPETLSFVESASVPVVAVTAWRMLFEHANIEARQSVVVLGGSGNVGAYAVQLASRAERA